MKEQMDRVTRRREFYENYNELSFNTPLPWSQGPRRMGTDKNADVLWVGNSWARASPASTPRRCRRRSSRSRIRPTSPTTSQSTRTTTFGAICGTADRITKYDPAKGEWTMFDLPVRGTEIRHVSLLERDGKTHVIVPVYRNSKMGVMTLRSEAELAALKDKAK